MGEKVSVIVPVYGVEKYLEACVRSILRQTYQNIEVILVDDGSPDNCPALCDAIAKRDPRVKVIHQENRGVSAARNAGLREAIGVFVGFVDGDDGLALSMLEHMVAVLIGEDADIVACGLQIFQEDDLLQAELTTSQLTCLTREEAVRRTLLLDEGLGGLCTDKLYRREILQGVWFKEDLPVAEDRLFMLEVLTKARGLWIDSARYCLHRCRKNSLSKGAFSAKEFGVAKSGEYAARLIEKSMPELQAEGRAYMAAVSLYVLEPLARDMQLRKTYQRQFNDLRQKLMGLSVSEIRNVRGRKFALYFSAMSEAPVLTCFLYFKLYRGIFKK